jgi:DNA-directed RNA polymerase specialized sigma24 family protein
VDDGQEFAEFVTGRMPAVLRRAHLLTGDRGRAEDLVQHAFAATYRHWRRITPPVVVRASSAPPGGWVGRPGLGPS